MLRILFVLLSEIWVATVCSFSAHGQALGQSASPPQGNNDPNLWLEEVYGPEAQKWVRRENERTLNTLLKDQRFQTNYTTAFRIRSERRESDIWRAGMAYRGYYYIVTTSPIHPHGLLQRTKVSSLETLKPEWSDVLDIDALRQSDGRNYTYLPANFTASCYETRCLFMFMTDEAIEFKEFDLDNERFVRNGFAISDRTRRTMPPAWINSDTLIVGMHPPGTSVDARDPDPRTLRLWRRGTPLSTAKVIFENPKVGSQTALTVFADDRSRRFIFADILKGPHFYSYDLFSENAFHRTRLPSGCEIIGVVSGQLIFKVSEEMQVGGIRWRPGSVVSVGINDLLRNSPTYHVLFSARGEESVTFVGVVHGVVLASISQRLAEQIREWRWNAGKWESYSISMPPNGNINFPSPFSPIGIVEFQNFFARDYYAIDTQTHSARRLAPPSNQPTDNEYDVARLTAKSADGTEVPYFVVTDRDVGKNEPRATILNGYGALNTPFLPYFDAIRNQLWLRSGGTFVLANVRGGGEFPGWHVTGLERRHTYEDFIAVANDLVRRRITTPSLLGIKGLSNGGLLVGTALNMRPDLFAAAVMENPVLDLWIHVPMDTEEYGRWSDPTEREFLLKTSPYHALQPNQKFPKVLVFDNSDDGNFPKAARKYIAKIKSFGQSYLYFEGLEGAHGCGATVEQCSLHDAIVYTYLQQQLMGATNKLMPRSEIDSNDSTRVRR